MQENNMNIYKIFIKLDEYKLLKNQVQLKKVFVILCLILSKVIRNLYICYFHPTQQIFYFQNSNKSF